VPGFSVQSQVLPERAHGLPDFRVIVQFTLNFTAGVNGGGVVLTPERGAYLRVGEAPELPCHVHGDLARQGDIFVTLFGIQTTVD